MKDYLDKEFLNVLDAQLADAVTFLPPAMRASFHAQMGALIRLTDAICSHLQAWDNAGPEIECSVNQWRAERARIRQRTGDGR